MHKNIYSEFFAKIFFTAIVVVLARHGFSQQMSGCPAPGTICTPAYKATSLLPDTAYYNCDLSKILDPQLPKDGSILYKWTAPDGSTSSGSTFIAAQEGIYTLCYDTVSPFNGCPRSDQIYVTKFTKSLAFAGEDVIMCSNQKTVVGVPPDNTAYTYDWKPTGLLIGGNLNKSTQTLFYTNTSPTPSISKLILYVTDKFTGCKDSDTVKVTIFPAPLLRINLVKPFYCIEEKVELNLIYYSPELKSNKTDFLIHGNVYVLPPAEDTVLSLSPIPETKYPAYKYKVSFQPLAAGRQTLHFSAVSGTGCSAFIDTVVQVYTPGPNPGDTCNFVAAANKPEAGISAHVYPNPFDGALEIGLDTKEINSGYRVEITDNRGVPVFTEAMSSLTISVDTAELLPGIYAVNIISGQQRYYQKLVKLH